MEIKIAAFIFGLSMALALGPNLSAQTGTHKLFKETIFETFTAEQKAILDRNMHGEENNPFIIRNGYVEINYEYLKEGTTFELEFFDDVSLVARIDRIVKRDDSGYSLFGIVDGEPLSQVVMVVKGSRVTGNVNYRDKLYHIRWMGSLVHSVAEVDWKNLPAGGPPLESTTPQANRVDANQAVSASSTDDGSTIDVLVVYTQAAASMGDIHSEIQLAVDSMNQALINSDVDLTIRLVHTAMLDYYETGIALTDLDRLLRANDGYMDGVQALRDRYGADLVALAVETMNQWGGLGQLNGAMPYEGNAFHVSLRSILPYAVFAHEVGHNLGMHHEKYQDPSGGAYSYSHGYVDLVNRFKTIMSYGTECAASGFYCPTINAYSSDSDSGVRYQGFVVGDSDDADNRQTVIDTKLAISRFRQSKSASEIASAEDVPKGCFAAAAGNGSYLDPSAVARFVFESRFLWPILALAIAFWGLKRNGRRGGGR